MAKEIKIDVDLLEEVFAILIGRLREVEGSDVVLNHDYFWSVPAPDIHDVDQSPEVLTIGQITECMEWLGAVARDSERATTYHFVWLGDVLRALGQSGRNGSYKN